jgi:hypothetical protein
VDGVAAAAFIDTGAELSAGNAALHAALLKHDPRHREVGIISITDITGGSIEATVQMIHKIKMTALEFNECPLVIANFQVFDFWGLRERPALLIGMNFLRQFSRVCIDYGSRELRFAVA